MEDVYMQKDPVHITDAVDKAFNKLKDDGDLVHLFYWAIERLNDTGELYKIAETIFLPSSVPEKINAINNMQVAGFLEIEKILRAGKPIQG